MSDREGDDVTDDELLQVFRDREHGFTKQELRAHLKLPGRPGARLPEDIQKPFNQLRRAGRIASVTAPQDGKYRGLVWTAV